jgi:O-succinylbenzoate synthase
MRIRRIEIRELRIPLVHLFETSFGRTTLRRILLVRVETEGAEGWGEVTCGESPLYNYETPETAWHILRDFLIPRVPRRDVGSPSELTQQFRAIRGHRMAKAALENALWVIEAVKQAVPLARLIGGTLDEVECGVSIGIQESVEALFEKIACELAAGYRRVKLKVKPGWDMDVLEAVRNRFPNIPLMADANSAYTLADFDHLKQFDRFKLMMIEQPLGWDDMIDHAKLQCRLDTPICLDESIHSADDARKAIEIGACRIINIKLGRVGGFTEACRVHGVCRERGVPVWCGGMLESGIGRAQNIALSTLPGFSLPGDVSASKRYWTEDIIDPQVTVNSEGKILVPKMAGLGFVPNMERIERVTVRKECFE